MIKFISLISWKDFWWNRKNELNKEFNNCFNSFSFNTFCKSCESKTSIKNKNFSGVCLKMLFITLYNWWECSKKFFNIRLEWCFWFLSKSSKKCYYIIWISFKKWSSCLNDLIKIIINITFAKDCFDDRNLDIYAFFFSFFSVFCFL